MRRTIEATPEQVRAAYAWLIDAFGGYGEDGELAGLTDAEVINGTDRHYEGGWAQFLRDGFYS